MEDVRLAKKAGIQHNRFSIAQARELGFSKSAIQHRIATGRLVIVEQGVLAFTPVDETDDWGRWMGATLTAPQTFLDDTSAAAAWGFWSLPRRVETVVRPGCGGPRRHGGLLVRRSMLLGGETTTHRRVPISSPERTLLQIAAGQSPRALARAVREAVRLRRTTIPALAEVRASHRGQRGTAALAAVIARYADLPLERARSGAEVRALELLRDHGFVLPGLNYRRVGEEADLSWPALRLIIEIDGGPFHLDRGEDARKQGIWEAAGWLVRRIDADDVYERPRRLLSLAAASNVPRVPV